MRKHGFFILSLALLAGVMSGQSRKELLRYADDAFKKEEYATAVNFYLKLLNQSTSDEERTYPYEVRSIYIPKKEKKDTTKSVTPTDSTVKDSVNYVKKDTLKKEEPKNMMVEIRDQYVVHQLAESYRLGHDYLNAEIWYKKSAMSQPKAYPDEAYWYALCLMGNGKYDSALVHLEKFVELKTGTPEILKRADKKILSCYFALDPLSVNPDIKITELDTIVNGGTASFSPCFYGENNAIAFASARKSGTGNEKIDPLYTTDVFTSTKNESGWSKPFKLGVSVNTFENEQPGTFSPDKQRFFFSRWTMNQDGVREHAIYMSRFLNNQWLQPVKLNQNVNAEGYQSMNPALNLDGSVLFFSSNRPGGKGKMDLWYCTIDEFGTAGIPVNMSAIINTPEDEITPFYDFPTKTLYFSSTGHPGLGGLDVFKSYGTEEDSLWTIPINMKGPINSSRDDAYFVVHKDQSSVFFASDRKLCSDCSGGSCYKIYSLDKGPAIITLKGTVYHKQTEKPLPNTLITLKDVNGDIQVLYLITDEDGKYSTVLREQVSYYMKAQKKSFFGDQSSITTTSVTTSIELTQDFYLDPVPSGDIVIPGIEYDFNKATLRPRSMLILDTLAEKLKLNDNMIVEISSHTDSRGNNEYNLKLSDDRAKSVVDYLISKGIAPERLLPKGYGEQNLLVTDVEISKMPTEDGREAGHQKNRRTAFKILKETELKME
jgi:OmpA-OmpF porin, OOP family